MRFMKHLSTASALISLVSSSLVERRKTSFSVHQTIPKPFIKSGPAAVAAVYQKFDATAPADVLAAAASNDGTVSSNPEESDQEYLSPVTIGYVHFKGSLIWHSCLIHGSCLKNKERVQLPKLALQNAENLCYVMLTPRFP